MNPLERLSSHDIPYVLTSFSALDRYFRHPAGPNCYVGVTASLVELAQVFDELEYPGLDRWDAAVDYQGVRYYLHCRDEEDAYPSFPVEMLNFFFDPKRERYLDPRDQYQSLRSKDLHARDVEPSLSGSLAAAVVAARYGKQVTDPTLEEIGACVGVPTELQRRVLSDVLTGVHAAKGMETLRRIGFVDCFLEELAAMENTNHSKDHHPEGDVWQHSLETLRYRKVPDLTLSLGLLLHDAGKPFSRRTREHRFDKHAEIGARIGRKLLRRMEFPEKLVGDVDYLVRNHMFPGALAELPLSRTEPLMQSELFPLLLELYRCDLSSTFRGPEGYYRACKVYRAFLRNRSNPFRTSEGKKMMRMYVDAGSR
jgi:poly(A) polymerase